MSRNALLIVDVQRDFLPGGTLAVPYGDEVIAPIVLMADQFDMVVATGDWHPVATRHFERWPVHCVRKTRGADIVLEKLAHVVIHKGTSIDADGYSAFSGNANNMEALELERVLARAKIDAVTVVGLALDYCIKETALDAERYGFATTVPLAATRAVDPTADLRVAQELHAAGVEIV